jgi:hypothetical protein
VTSSPWDGGDRRALLVAIAMVGAWDLGGVVIELLGARSGPPHPHAPAWLLVLADAPALVVAIALVGVGGLALALRSRTRLVGLVVALASSAVLGEALAAATEGPWRARFFVGAALLGAVVGEAWSRWAGAGETTRGRALEAGALGMLAATWFGAGLSKLGGAGVAWADATTLRAVAVAHAHVDAPGLAATIARSATAARGLAIATLVVQLAAPTLLLGARMRLLIAVALVCFHVGVAVVTRIGYWQPVVLLLAFALPWPRWIAGLRVADTHEPALEPARERRATVGVIAIAIVLVAIAWWPGVRAYTTGHHGGRAVVAHTAVERFGPLAVGDALPGGWRIAALEVEDVRTSIVIAHAAHGRVVLSVSPRAAASAHSPFDGESVAVAYAQAAAPVDAFAPAALECARRLDAAPPW